MHMHMHMHVEELRRQEERAGYVLGHNTVTALGCVRQIAIPSLDDCKPTGAHRRVTRTSARGANLDGPAMADSGPPTMKPRFRRPPEMLFPPDFILAVDN